MITPPSTIVHTLHNSDPLQAIEKELPTVSEAKVHEVAVQTIRDHASKNADLSEKWYQNFWRKLYEAFCCLAAAIDLFFKRLFGINTLSVVRVEEEKFESNEEILEKKISSQEPSQTDTSDKSLILEGPASMKSKELFSEIQELSQASGKIVDKGLEKPPLIENPSLDEVIYLGGIPNVGNSCYINSCLQAILATPLRYCLDKGLPKPSRPEMALGESAEAYKKRLNLYFSLSSDWKTFSDVRKKLNKFKNKYDDWEVPGNRLGHLLDAAKAFRKKIFESGICPTFEMSDISRQKDAPELMLGLLGALGIQFSLSTKTTSIEEPSVFAVENAFTRLLELQMGQNSTSFQMLLEGYGAKEIIDDPDNQWKQDNKNYSKYSREYKISGELPEIFVIQLKRMQWNKNLKMREKLSAKVTWDSDTLDLACVTDPDLYSKGESTKYSPIAYVTHQGTPFFGHYTANVLNESNWFRLDDSAEPQIRMYDQEKLDRENGYLFILKRVNTPQQFPLAVD